MGRYAHLQVLCRYSTFKWSLKIPPRTFEIFQTTMLQTGRAQHHRRSPKTEGEAPTSTAKPFRSQMPTDAARYWKIFVPTIPGMVGKNECPVTRVIFQVNRVFCLPTWVLTNYAKKRILPLNGNSMAILVFLFRLWGSL